MPMAAISTLSRIIARGISARSRRVRSTSADAPLQRSGGDVPPAYPAYAHGTDPDEPADSSRDQ